MTLKEIYPIDKYIKFVNDFKEYTGFNTFLDREKVGFIIYGDVYISDNEYLCYFEIEDKCMIWLVIDDFEWEGKHVAVDLTYKLPNDYSRAHIRKGYAPDDITPEKVFKDIINNKYCINHGDSTSIFINYLKRSVKINQIKKII